MNSQMSILLVEGSPDDIRFYQGMLKKSQVVEFETIYATRLDEALKLLKKKQFDVILLDLDLPDSHGLNTVRKLRSQTHDVPIVILTGLDNMDIASQAIEVGAQDYLIKKDLSSGLLPRVLQYVIERKHTQGELKESEETIKTLYDSTPLPYQSLNEDGSFKDVNLAWLQTLGYERDEVIGKYYKDFLHPDWQLHFETKFTEFKKSGYIHDVQFKIRHKNGHFLDISFEGRIGYYPDGSFKEIYCIFQDKIERKQVEGALKEKEDRYRQIYHHSPDSIIIHDLDMNILDANNMAVKEFGYTKEELLTMKVLDLHPEMEIKHANQILTAMKNKKVLDVETKFIRKDRSVFFAEATPCKYMLGSKQVIHVVIRDITKRKQAEEALTAEKERLAVTLRSIGEGVITTDTNGNIVMLNKAAEALTGWNTDEAAGRSLLEVFNVIHVITRQQCENPVERVFATNGMVGLEKYTCLVAKDGREIIIADSSAPIYDNANCVVGVVIVFRDMTEKQKLEDFQHRTQKLESLGVLAGGIAHDFNNIFSGIFGYIEMAKKETTEEKVSTYLTESLSSLDRARSLTRQLLTFAKGGAPIKRVEHLFPFVQETVHFALSGSSISSRFQIQEKLWPCDFDKNQISQVIENLVINAQQAMPNGGTIEVSVGNISLSVKEHISLDAGKYVKLSIKDQGIGIPKALQPHIFDPYYSTKSKGHGLGLAMSYSIINRHGGCIDVESEPGKGSTFHLYLPASTESISTLAGKTPGKHMGSGTFLIMDDEKAIRDIMKLMLESFGYTVVLKENGKDAVDFFMTETKANRKLTGMVFDLTIPGGMGGKEAIGEIRKICSDTPVFVASGYSVDPIMANPGEYGFTASLCKPFTMTELSRMLEKHLKKHT